MDHCYSSQMISAPVGQTTKLNVPQNVEVYCQKNQPYMNHTSNKPNNKA